MLRSLGFLKQRYDLPLPYLPLVLYGAKTCTKYECVCHKT